MIKIRTLGQRCFIKDLITKDINSVITNIDNTETMFIIVYGRLKLSKVLLMKFRKIVFVIG